MTDTEDRIERAARSPAWRYVHSAAYRELVESAAFTASVPLRLKAAGRDVLSVGIASSDEISRVLHAAPGSDLFLPRVPGQMFATLRAAPARVPALVTTVLSDSGAVYLVHETDRSADGGGVPDDAALHESNLVVEGVSVPLRLWGASMTTVRQLFADGGQAEAVLDRFLRQVVLQQLEADMLTGDGSETATTRRLVGILNTAGVGAVAKGAGEPIAEALARAVQVVSESGHSVNPPAVVATPADLGRLFTEKDPATGFYIPWDDILPQVGAYIPSTQMEPGTALVGDFADGATLYLEKNGARGSDSEMEWSLELSDSDRDLFKKRQMAVNLFGYVFFDVAAAAAFCKVTDL